MVLPLFQRAADLLRSSLFVPSLRVYVRFRGKTRSAAAEVFKVLHRLSCATYINNAKRQRKYPYKYFCTSSLETHGELRARAAQALAQDPLCVQGACGDAFAPVDGERSVEDVNTARELIVRLTKTSIVDIEERHGKTRRMFLTSYSKAVRSTKMAAKFLITTVLHVFGWGRHSFIR